MIADTSDSRFETAVKLLTAPIWLPIYLIGKGCQQLIEARRRRRPGRALEGDVLPPVWVPKTDVERAVFAAIVLAGGPVTNAQLAKLMRVSPAEASKRVSQLAGVLCKERIGREVRISIPSYLH